MSPLSESPLGQPLALGSDQDRGLAMRLSFSTNDPVIPSLQRKQGDGIIQLKGKKKGMSGLSVTAIWKAVTIRDVKFRDC